MKHALDDLGLEYTAHPVPGSRRNRGEGYEGSGQYGVPVLVDRTNGVEGMPESDDIVRYLHREHGDGGPPESPGVLARLRGLLG